MLIVGDGPLLSLPFSALTRRNADGRRQFVVEWKPTLFAASATTYIANFRLDSLSNKAGALVAFGDPVIPLRARAQQDGELRNADTDVAKEIAEADNTAQDKAESDAAPADAELAAELARSGRLGRLPATRGEVTGIVGLYGSQAQALLGRDATEERAKTLGPSARILHLATHGLINDRLPLNSGLLFSPPQGPKEGNGLLQAWEIYDGLRLTADLVTLSACDTALGEEARGEGLMSLTRAFQVAGARTVVASLWKIADTSTASLMTRFYRELKSGNAKDASLQAAQRALLSGEQGSGRWRHPFYWAAFQAYGAWQ